MACRPFGFTLIEILIVIVIIGILASLVLAGILGAMDSAKYSSTEALLGTLKGALENYRTRWGDYPPSTLTEFRVRLPNEINNGAEALTGCLSSTLRGGILYQPSDSERFSNVDGDSAPGNVCKWYFGDNQLREIVDFYGRPVLYLHHKDYAGGARTVRTYILQPTGKEVEYKPVKSEATKTFANPDTFQILSAGKDGVPGTPDDVVGW